MKIIILHRNSFDAIGGVESTIYYMAEVLKKMGHTPVVVAKHNGKSNDDDGFCKVLRFTPSRLSLKLLCPFIPTIEYFNAKKKLKTIIEEEQPDYIITRDNILSYVVSQFFDNERIVYIPLGIIKYYNAGIRKFSGLKGFIIECIRYIQMKQESFFQLKAIKNISKVIVFSENLKNQIFKALGQRDGIKIVHPGVSPKFHPDEKACAIRDEFNISPDKNILLFVGRVVQEKNVRMLIDAYAASNNSNTVLVVVGGGDDLNFVKNKAQTLNIADKVVFAGFRRDTEAFYREADLFVLPSYYEAFGNVIPEAMASGTPTVGFKTQEGCVLTAIAELIEDGKNGFICETYSTEALTDAINRAVALMNTDQYDSIKAYCAQLATEKFTWNNFMQQTLNLLEQKEEK